MQQEIIQVPKFLGDLGLAGLIVASVAFMMNQVTGIIIKLKSRSSSKNGCSSEETKRLVEAIESHHRECSEHFGQTKYAAELLAKLVDKEANMVYDNHELLIKIVTIMENQTRILEGIMRR